MNKRFLGPVAVVAAMLGLVSGAAYAGSVAFAPAHKPAQVELVQPAAQVITPTVDPAIAKAKADAAAKVKAVKVAKAKAAAKAAAKKKKAAAVAKTQVAAPVAVNSVQAPAPKPVTVQRQAIVSDPTPTEPTTPEPAATTPVVAPNDPVRNTPPPPIMPHLPPPAPTPTNS